VFAAAPRHISDENTIAVNARDKFSSNDDDKGRAYQIIAGHGSNVIELSKADGDGDMIGGSGAGSDLREDHDFIGHAGTGYSSYGSGFVGGAGSDIDGSGFMELGSDVVMRMDRRNFKFETKRMTVGFLSYKYIEDETKKPGGGYIDLDPKKEGGKSLQKASKVTMIPSHLFDGYLRAYWPVKPHSDITIGGRPLTEFDSVATSQTAECSVLTKIGPYALDPNDKLGTGASGTVFKGVEETQWFAKSGQESKPVAIKYLSDDSLDTFRIGLRDVAKNSHGRLPRGYEAQLQEMKLNTGKHELAIMNMAKGKPGLIQIIDAYDASPGDTEDILHYHQNVYLVMQFANKGRWRT